LDHASIASLAKRKPMPHFFAPRGNESWFRSLGVPDSHAHILDWWESRRLQTTYSDKNKLEVDITCTPCQHFSGRTLGDVFKHGKLRTLWASWAIEEVTPTGISTEPKKLWFGGDTGYRAVLDDQNEDEAEKCPVFKEIGEKFGYFDVGLIPIGLVITFIPYQASETTSERIWVVVSCHLFTVHHKTVFRYSRMSEHEKHLVSIGGMCCLLFFHPLFANNKARAWQLTIEEVDEPPRKLKEEAAKIGLETDAFITCDIGQTLFF
jgi:N-acyl-phosphatidylethanolamine-hydrolysing phospholipase D